MKKFSLLIVFLSIFLFAGFSQEPASTPERDRGYLIGPGDEITGKVLGEDQFNFVATVDEDGKIEVPFFEKPIDARCKTERELRADVVKLLSKYLRSPQLSLRATERKSRPPATIYGEVRQQQQVTLARRARLLELLSFAGGVTEKAGGMVQIFRTQPPICSETDENNWKIAANDPLSVPSRMYSLSSVRSGREEANPEILPGDIIVVSKASPVYVIGEVMALREVIITEKGLSLTEAIAYAGGFSREAKTKDISIRRLKPDSKEREIISVNFELIKKGEQKDVLLQPEDIVEVGKSKKSVAQTFMEILVGGARSFSNVLPQRVLY